MFKLWLTFSYLCKSVTRQNCLDADALKWMPDDLRSAQSRGPFKSKFKTSFFTGAFGVLCELTSV